MYGLLTPRRCTHGAHWPLGETIAESGSPIDINYFHRLVFKWMRDANSGTGEFSAQFPCASALDGSPVEKAVYSEQFWGGYMCGPLILKATASTKTYVISTLESVISDLLSTTLDLEDAEGAQQRLATIDCCRAAIYAMDPCRTEFTDQLEELYDNAPMPDASGWVEWNIASEGHHSDSYATFIIHTFVFK